MFTALTLKDFKSFPNAELRFGPITTIIGANATGKSNLRDALKFLHAVGRGMTLPEIFGGKSSVGWDGIRGGAPGTVRHCQRELELTITINGQLQYSLRISVGAKGPLVAGESLFDADEMLFATRQPEDNDARILHADLIPGGDYRRGHVASFPAHQPLLSQIADVTGGRADPNASRLRNSLSDVVRRLSSIRFIDFAPAAMRQPSVPGAKTISETGDNLSSVLRYLVDDVKKEAVLAGWIKALTPMDVARIGFEEYPDGKILAQLVESGGRKIPLSSASDGTLRFLGILASVLSPEAPSLLCFEEIETGLHPVRVQLVSDLLQKETADGKPQVLLTTHSPSLLGWLGREHRDHAYLAYRLPETEETRLKSFAEIPGLEAALAKSDAARLFESGWFEDAVFFAEAKPSPVSFVAEDSPDRKP